MKFQTALCLTVVVVFAAFSGSDAESCLLKFKNIQSLKATGDLCIKRLASQGVNITDIPMPNDLEKLKWDDKCFANCTMREMRFFSNKTVQKENIIKMINENAPKEAKTNLIKVVNDCAPKRSPPKNKDANKAQNNHNQMKEKISPKFDNKMKQEKSMRSNNFECKIAARFMHCFQEKVNKISC